MKSNYGIHNGEIYHADELMHFGVKGMKWGVRRDAKLLANRRRNTAVRKIKDDYDLGKITKEQRRSGIRSANAAKKQYLQKNKERLKNMQSEKEAKQYKTEIAKQTINEVPSRRLKKGVSTVNKILGTGSTAYALGLGAAATAINPMLGISIMATSGVTTAGMHYLAQIGINKLM